MGRGRPRFLAWYRLVPLALVFGLGLISLVYSYAPSFFFKALYPLEYEEYIIEASERHGVDPCLVAAIIESESNWDADAESSKGATGLMQLMADTAEQMASWGLVDSETYASDNLSDPATNIEYGCAFLAYLLDYYDGSVDKAVAAYNAGMGTVNGWLESDTVLLNAITFPETQSYLLRVKLAYARYQDLYLSVLS